MSNEELIKALRCCADDSTGCGECPFVGKCTHAYYMDLKLAAADAIQTLCDELATYHAKSVIDNKRIAELEEKIPKHGEWIDCDGENVPLDKDGDTTDSCYCSVCGDWLTASDDYSTRGRYCPNCGAKMDGGKADADS